MSRRERKLARRQVLQPATIARDDGSPIGECTMLDVSAGGARLKVADGVDVPSEFVLLLSKFDHRIRRRCVIAWRGEAEVGIRFVLT